MARWLLRGVGALLILGAVVRGGGALNLWQVPDFRPTQSVSECVAEGQRGYETGIAQALGISREQIDPAAAAKMTQAMSRLCRSAATRSARQSLPELFRADPVAFQHLCRAGLDASLKTRPDAFWFTSRAERAHLLREHCQLLLKYMGDDQSTNWPRLIARIQTSSFSRAAQPFTPSWRETTRGASQRCAPPHQPPLVQRRGSSGASSMTSRSRSLLDFRPTSEPGTTSSFRSPGTKVTPNLLAERRTDCPALAGLSCSSPGWTRTNNPPVNSRMLCQLSYRGTVLSGREL